MENAVGSASEGATMAFDEILHFSSITLWLVLLLSAPALLVAAVIGFGIGMLQTLTSIQDQSLSFALKIAGVLIVLALTGGWMGSELLDLTRRILESFPEMTR